MRALLIEFDLNSGKRAGDINPREKKLVCRGWQNLESDPAVEIRLVEDDRDLSALEGVQGVTILEGKDAINQAIEKQIPVKYVIHDRELMREHMKEKRISLDTLAGKNAAETAKFAFDNHLAGVAEVKPHLIP